MTCAPKLPDATQEKTAEIREHMRQRGMTFEVFLPEGLSDWLQEMVTKSVFESPKEAAFVAFQSLRDLHAHPEIQKRLLAAMLQTSMNDPRPPIPAEEALERLTQQLPDDSKPVGS